MSTPIVDEEDALGFNLTRFWGGKELLYQITQRYKDKTEDDSTRNIFGYVQVSKQDLEEMLRRINKLEKSR